jgi:hypothetical protein
MDARPRYSDSNTVRFEFVDGQRHASFRDTSARVDSDLRPSDRWFLRFGCGILAIVTLVAADYYWTQAPQRWIQPFLMKR